MSDVKGLSDVGRGILDDEFFSRARGVGTVRRLPCGAVVCEGVYLVEDFADEGGGVELEM